MFLHTTNMWFVPCSYMCKMYVAHVANWMSSEMIFSKRSHKQLGLRSLQMLGLETLLAIIHLRNNYTCSLFEDAVEHAFAQGLGAGLGSGNFNFLEMKLPCM